MIAVDLQGLGDVICLASDCSIGQSLVDQMVATFNSIGDDLNTGSATASGGVSGFGDGWVDNADYVAFTTKFSTSVTALKSAYDAQMSNIWIETFNSRCCIVKTIGSQAQDLTNQMLISVGRAPISQVNTTGPGGSITDALTALIGVAKVVGVLGGIALGVVGIFYGVKAVKTAF